MNNFTPGPWVFETTANYYVILGANASIHKESVNALANAALIVEAPELLTTLQAVTEALALSSNTPLASLLVAKANMLIARAGGTTKP
jgi:hypothetical protein